MASNPALASATTAVASSLIASNDETLMVKKSTSGFWNNDLDASGKIGKTSTHTNHQIGLFGNQICRETAGCAHASPGSSRDHTQSRSSRPGFHQTGYCVFSAKLAESVVCASE